MVANIAKARAGHTGGLTILVVEDNALVRMMVSGCLWDEGFCVLEASSGDEAIVSLMRRDVVIDAVLTDRNLPGRLNGVAIADLVRGAFPNMTIIMMSSYEPDMVLGAKLNGFLQKPFFASELVKVVRMSLAEKSI